MHTTCFDGVLRRKRVTAQQVGAAINYFKMARVNTSRSTAKMVDLQTRKDWLDAELVGPTMSANEVCSSPEVTISPSIVATCPEPTTLGEFDLCPEPFRESRIGTHRELPPGAMRQAVTSGAAALIIAELRPKGRT